ncbi:cytochrome bc1 complex diheme cytochrome c subunit [Aestuariimicrobium ganziense]|uniref:cytochrome bc1 complex diheme cytochrome c subunit n=1 Tax=Aestuariimicrobium ganziense TaxID=2773677 RepID=UPI0019432CAF|nr:c-type cytochrome [Aestuariimicrobium ganziense]
MRFLTRRRRSKAAKPLAILMALFAMGLLYSVASPATQSSAETASPEQIARGKAIFEQTCSSCHGLNGEGTSEGPTLIGVGSMAVDFQMGTGRMPMARPEAQAPAKPTDYSAEEIAAVAAYVQAEFGGGPQVPTSDQYSADGMTSEKLARGGELFKTNCSACHNIEGTGGALPNGKYAPSLEKTSDKHIYEAMRTGPQQMPVFAKGTLTDEDTREIIGYLQTLHAQPEQGGLHLGGLGPVGEGFWAWVLGVGGLSLVAVWLAKKGARAR